MTEGPFLGRAPSADKRGEGETPPRGTEAHLETLAVAVDPAPRNAVTRIPAGLSLAAGGTPGAAMSPPGVSSSTHRAFTLSRQAQRRLPQGSGTPPACSRARQPGHLTALLPGALGPWGRPSQPEHSLWALPPSPGSAQLSGAQRSTLQPPPSPHLWASRLSLRAPPPRLRAHHAAALREPARASWRPPGPRFTDSILPRSGWGSGTTLVRVLTPTPFTVAAAA